MPAIKPFRPDLGELVSGTPANVLANGNGYGPRPSLQTAPGAAALAAAPRGAFGAYLPDGLFRGFAATSTEVYTLGADFAFTALTPTFTVPADDDEAMAQFDVFMLASNTTDGMYAYNIDTPAGLNAVSGAPAARYLFSANNQVVALGAGSSLLNRLATSAFGSHTNWTSRGASKQDMNDGGAFTGGGDLGNGAAIVLQLRAVRRMSFGNAGGGALFRLDKLGDDVGCVHPRAQVTHNGVCYFLHSDGFYACDGASAPVNIGAGKVNNWFLARCADLKKVYFSIDPKNTLVRIRYAASGDGSTATVYQSILDYNYVTKEFIPGTEATSAIFRMGTPGYTLNTISSTFGVLNAWSQYPLDSAFWQGGSFRLAGLDATFKVGFFDGTPAAATLETITDGDGMGYTVNACMPVTDDTAATVELGVKDRLADSFTWKTAEAMTETGIVPLRGTGKFQRYRVVHAAGGAWTRTSEVTGIDKQMDGPR